MPYRCEICGFEWDEESGSCARCGSDCIEFFENPEIIRVEFHKGNSYVSFYKDCFVGYSVCRSLGTEIRDMHRSRQFELKHPDDLEWIIRGCKEVKNPTLLNGKDITGIEEKLNDGDEVTVGSLKMKISFVKNR